MSSNDLLKKVIIRLGLNVTYKKPYSLISLYEDSPLLIIPDSLTQENLDCFVSFKIEVSKNGAVLIKMKETGKEYSLPLYLLSFECQKVYLIYYMEQKEM